MDRGNMNEVNYYEFIRDIDCYNVDDKNISLSHTTNFKSF